MKVVVSLPDRVFRTAEWLARTLRKSRDRLYAEAIAEYVSNYNATALTTWLNAVYSNESSNVDPALNYDQFLRLSRTASEGW